MASNAQSLEDMITEITSPLTTHMDLNAFKKIYDRINIDPNGPELALRLFAHKIQSPVEKEALSALVILDLCVQNCGPNFLKELGKFKFLNELMKILLPNHLGLVTPPNVRDKCVMLMFIWQRDFGDKYPKLREAYEALKAQNVITEDPVIQDDSESNKMDNRMDIFKNSRHKDKLARLLKSKNPNDFREANAIIKKIVNEENARVERRSRRALELETLRSNADLLEEMLRCVEPNTPPSASDKDVMEEIVANIKRTRPIIFELALTDDDREEGFLTDVIQTCSSASSVLERYEVLVLHKPPSTVEDPALLGTSRPKEPRQPASQPVPNPTTDDLLSMSSDDSHDLLRQDLLNLGINDSTPARNQPQLSVSNQKNATSPSNVDLLGDLLSSSPEKPVNISPPDPFNLMLPQTQSVQMPVPSLTTKNSSALGSVAAAVPIPKNTNSVLPKNSAEQVFSELDMDGREMLGLRVRESESVGNRGVTSYSGTTTEAHGSQREPHFEAAAPPISVEMQPLASLPALSSSEIRPHPIHNQPIRVFPMEEKGSTAVEVMLHCTANKPHPSVVVLVAVVTNLSNLPLTNLLLRFGVEKPLKVRQLDLSTSNLPAFCSFLPPSPAQQILYVQRPAILETTIAKLKFQLSFTMDEEAVLESGIVSVPLD
ncbi:hypothetical protein Aperf_G00000114051 [Anoplocephala perfoliata]